MAFNSPILGPSGVGMLGNDGRLTRAARDAFTAQVVLLMAGGNLEGKGPKISSILGVPFPPIPGPKLVDPDRLLIDPTNPLGDLLWFYPSPLALITAPVLADPDKDYQKIIVDNLYEPLVQLLNIPGNIAAIVLYDPTCFFDIQVDIPEFLLALNVALPNANLHAAFAAKYNIGIDLVAKLAVDLPKIPQAPPIPPTLPIPSIPDFDFIIFPELFLSILSLPLEILKPDFVISLISIPTPDVGELFIKIAGIVLEILLKALEAIGLLTILPKLLAATIIVLLQNLVSMLVCDIIGVVLGTGQVVKAAGSLLALR